MTNGARLPVWFARAVWLLSILAFAGGCRFVREGQSPSLPLDFAQVLPAGWEAIGTWQEVNIDTDASVEYLLLFTFDQGQVGAAIFDGQIGSDMVGVVDVSVDPNALAITVQPVPPQPLGSFRPYRLLPSYWSYTFGGGGVGQGIVALPRDHGNLLATQVDSGPQEGNADRAVVLSPHAELVIRGGETHLTFVWWRDALSGYGVTQLAAEGGFRGVDWESWAKEPVPIIEIAGLYPLTDYRARSLLCREKLFRRVLAQQTDAAGVTEQPAIAFTEEDLGITFCLEPAPAHPYYPEGVALAYLHLAGQAESAQRSAMLAPLLTVSANEAQVAADAGAGLLAVERVEDIATHPTVPALPASLQSGGFSPTTVVCIELAQRADPRFRRWITLTLRYQPPDLDSGLPERWTVSGATQIPAPSIAPREPYCDSILERR